MAVETGLRTNGIALIPQPDPEPKAYLGYYPPFPGVRYYTILDERDIADGRNRIGPVGWRPPPPLYTGRFGTTRGLPLAG